MTFKIRKIEDKPKRRIPWQAIALTALKFGRPVTRWYSDWKERQKQKKQHTRRVRFLKIAVVVLLAILLLLVIISTVLSSIISANTWNIGTIFSFAETPLPKDENGFTNILILGEGGVESAGQDLTDSIMVGSLDPTTKSVVLLSLPRDTYFLTTDNIGKGRINSMYRDEKYQRTFREGEDPETASLNAMRELAAEIGRKINLTIHHVVKVDFAGFIEAVDAIGGVDIDVPYDIVDDKYPGPNYTYETFELTTGPNHLDGDMALKYARSRSTTSDFDRSARQQQLLAALWEKTKSEGVMRTPGTILSLLKILTEHVETTLLSREIMSLARIGRWIQKDLIIAMQLHNMNGLYGELLEHGGFLYSPPRDFFDGASVLLPISYPEFPITWKQVQVLTELLFRHRELYLEDHVIHVLNAGAPSGHARKLGNELIRYGFEVGLIANAGIEKQEQSFIVGSEKIGNLLGFSSSSLPPTLPPENQGDVTIILGKDYNYEPLQNIITVTSLNE